MTYTFKLSRRLAVSRARMRCFAALFLLVACAGEEATEPQLPAASAAQPIALRIVPSAVIIETNQPIRFRGEGQTLSGAVVLAAVAWEATGGTIRSDGTFSSASVGRFTVVGRGRGWRRADTSVVVVVPPARDLVGLRVAPTDLTLTSGTSHRFSAAGHRRDDPTPSAVGVIWQATGGSIDAGGHYHAGTVPGRYHVIGRTTAGSLADTAVVTIGPDRGLPDEGPPPPNAPENPEQPEEPESPAPPSPAPRSPEPPGRVPPDPALARVILRPSSATLLTGSARQFQVYGRTRSGDSVAVRVTYEATGGKISSKGLYSASAKAGRFRIVASAGGHADTAEVTLNAPAPSPSPAPPPPPPPPPLVPPPTLPVGSGIPFGPFHLPEDQYGRRSYTGSLLGLTPSGAASQLAAAKAKGIRLFVSLPDSRGNYINSDRTFNLAMWKRQMDRWKSQVGLLERYYASGTITGNYLVDEPHCKPCWGGKSISYADVEEMGRYAKAMLPTIPTMVRVHPGWLRSSGRRFPSIDAAWAQYEGPLHMPSYRMTPEQFRDQSVADARALGMGLVFGMNVLDGGDGRLRKNGTMIHSTRFQMSAAEVERVGTVLASEPYACALINWRYSPSFSDSRKTAAQLAAIREFDDRSDVKAALAAVVAAAGRRDRRDCR